MTTERMSEERIRYLTRWIDDDDERELFAELDRARAAEVAWFEMARSNGLAVATVEGVDHLCRGLRESNNRLAEENDKLRAENEALRALVRRMFAWMGPDPDMGMDAVDECEAIDHEAARLGVVEEP